MSKREELWHEFLNRLKTDHAFSAKFRRRFWSRIKAVPGGCWEWQRGRHKLGYGIILYKEAAGPFTSHRVAFAIRNPDFKWDKQHICHRCDNPPCCNPDHLFPGTMKDNIADCIRKGRFKFLKRKVGKEVHTTKVSDEDAQFIVKYFQPNKTTGPHCRAALAARFGVSGMTIYRIASGYRKGVSGRCSPNRNLLTEEQKQEILSRYSKHAKRGPNTTGNLAKEFGVPKFVISNLIHKSHHVVQARTAP